MSSTIKTVIIVLVLSGIGYFGYSYLNKAGSSSDVLLTQTSANTSKMGAEVLSALNQLKTLKLDGSIFQDKIFLSLEDTSISLTPEPVGRINPFSPIGVENASAARFVPASTTRATSTPR